MIRGGGTAALFIAVMGEALKKFGRITPHNQEQVTRWVRRRMAEIQAGEHDPVDTKARAAGDS